MTTPQSEGVPWQRRLILAGAAAMAIATGFGPSAALREAVLRHFGAPAYEGIWILIPHLFLYSTLSTLVCAACWYGFVRAGWLEPPSFALSRRSTLAGLLGGVLALALLVSAFYAAGQMGAFHSPRIDPWIMSGNFFSNIFEEFIFRGFILAALAAAFGFWPAAILSSAAFGAAHSQFPIEMQILGGVTGVIWAIAGRWARSLVAPIISHMTLDWVIDPFL
jgi:membrane protease YdiL (CAAX protease family)